MDSNLVRDRMAANPFAPVQNSAPENRQLHALDYTAFYLGEIEKHLGKIAAELNSGSANGAKIALALTGLQHVLPTLLSK